MVAGAGATGTRAWLIARTPVWLTPSAPDRKRQVSAIEQTLGTVPMPINADDRALTGRAPWIVHRGDLHRAASPLA